MELICDRAYLPALEELVESATTQLDVAQWEFFPSLTTNALVPILGDAVDRGVHVRLLLDEAIEENEQAIDWFQGAGIDARLDNSSNHKVHAKLLIADGSTALVGSTNWSEAAIDRNQECNLLLREGGAPAYLDSWYQQVWEASDQRDSPALEQSDGAPATALVNDDLLPALVSRIEAANDSIDFTLYATYLQPDNPEAPAMQVFRALASAVGRGVEVRGVVDWSSWNPTNNESNEAAASWLSVRGVLIRWDDPSVNMHAKTFRIDEGLQVQTANISSSGFTSNHEAGAWTREEAPIADFREWFDGLWNSGTEAPP
ncbi:MAG: phospholipase D-like domain-containing protein [Myxococcota bacterium]|nr:phospholipase D-like domain-containing protein [Myxococcota bacterium]